MHAILAAFLSTAGNFDIQQDAERLPKPPPESIFAPHTHLYVLKVVLSCSLFWMLMQVKGVYVIMKKRFFSGMPRERAEGFVKHCKDLRKFCAS